MARVATYYIITISTKNIIIKISASNVVISTLTPHDIITLTSDHKFILSCPKQGLLDESHNISPAACAVEKFENITGDEGNIKTREVGIVIASIVIFVN
jgi:hypothetical protein